MRDIDDTTATGEYVGLPPKTLDNYRSLGVGPKYLKVGRHVRYRRSDVDEWLKSRTITPRNAS